VTVAWLPELEVTVKEVHGRARWRLAAAEVRLIIFGNPTNCWHLEESSA
jgi:hypothetical protein